MSSPRSRRSFWNLQWTDRHGTLTREASAALDDISDQLNPWAFTDVTGAATSTLTTHAAVTLSGAQDEVWPLTVRGQGSPQISVDGGTTWGADAIARAGDGLQVRLTSSGSGATALTATVYGPGRSTAWSVTTA